MINLQNSVLNQIRKDRIPVTIFLMNGVQVRGIIQTFDRYSITLIVNQKQQLIYKRAVSTIVPQKPVKVEVSTKQTVEAEV
jgi:host factor-I protein